MPHYASEARCRSVSVKRPDLHTLLRLKLFLKVCTPRRVSFVGRMPGIFEIVSRPPYRSSVPSASLISLLHRSLYRPPYIPDSCLSRRTMRRMMECEHAVKEEERSERRCQLAASSSTLQGLTVLGARSTNPIEEIFGRSQEVRSGMVSARVLRCSALGDAQHRVAAPRMA